MRVKAQVAMVMNLDKCIGCHTCSVTCKNVWTNREGAEYMWFNNVETKPGVGYPQNWEDQQQRHGGWQLDKRGRLQLKSGSRLKRLANIFHNPICRSSMTTTSRGPTTMSSSPRPAAHGTSQSRARSRRSTGGRWRSRGDRTERTTSPADRTVPRVTPTSPVRAACRAPIPRCRSPSGPSTSRCSWCISRGSASTA